MENAFEKTCMTKWSSSFWENFGRISKMSFQTLQIHTKQERLHFGSASARKTDSTKKECPKSFPSELHRGIFVSRIVEFWSRVHSFTGKRQITFWHFNSWNRNKRRDAFSQIMEARCEKATQKMSFPFKAFYSSRLNPNNFASERENEKEAIVKKYVIFSFQLITHSEYLWKVLWKEEWSRASIQFISNI